uniref:Uncharacterized protein n=1 Tax=Daphnia galeata TaxID=27404 RepID=A0A8J2WG78_9CRUS|nr:unnamed protein product [Daphnia galeata]
MDHSSAAIGLEENKITAAIEPESPSSSSSSSSPVPAIKLKRKCSSGWTLSNNGTHSASAAAYVIGQTAHSCPNCVLNDKTDYLPTVVQKPKKLATATSLRHLKDP